MKFVRLVSFHRTPVEPVCDEMRVKDAAGQEFEVSNITVQGVLRPQPLSSLKPETVHRIKAGLRRYFGQVKI